MSEESREITIRFLCALKFSIASLLAYMLNSLARVSRRVDVLYFVNLIKHATPHARALRPRQGQLCCFSTPAANPVAHDDYLPLANTRRGYAAELYRL